MKVVIAGSRNISNYQAVDLAVKLFNRNITEVVSGGARGVDQLGELWANNHRVPVKQYLPDWNKHGKAAGVIRNRQMADYAEAAICIWDGKSTGTKNIIDEMERLGKECLVIIRTYVHDYPVREQYADSEQAS